MKSDGNLSKQKSFIRGNFQLNLQSKKLAFEVVLSIPPILHHLSQQPLPIRPVIRVQRVCKFVGNHVINKVRRRLHEFTVQY